MKNKVKSLKFRRRREGKTNYSKRLNMLKSYNNRLIVRKSLKTITIQIAKYDPKGDTILCSVSSSTLKKNGWDYSKKSIPAAYLTGLKIAKVAQSKGIKKAILDTGLIRSIKGNKIYAAVKGVVDGGLEVPVDEKMFPKEDRLKGENIKKYAETTKSPIQFSKYNKENKNVKSITEVFEKTKKSIETE